MFVLNGNAERVVRLLKSCGLNEYESRAYFSLLLTEKAKMGSLAKMSSVPQSKIYLTVDNLMEKDLVEVDEEIPKTATARQFEPYLSREINSKQKEISRMIDAGNFVRESVYALKPVVLKHKDRCRVFEPKYRRKT